MHDEDDDDDDDESLAREILVGSIEDLEEGYFDDSDGPDHDGYTSKERELREIAGVGGMSMEIGDLEISEYMEQRDEQFSVLDDDQDAW